jgi:hypothetical protein
MKHGMGLAVLSALEHPSCRAHPGMEIRTFSCVRSFAVTIGTPRISGINHLESKFSIPGYTEGHASLHVYTKRS